MGIKEIIMIMGAILILGLISLSLNSQIFLNYETIMENDLNYMAFGIAQQYIDEAKSKDFDERIITSIPNGLPATFTATANLGPDANESYSNKHMDSFDDIDDFNGLVVTDTLEQKAIFVTSIQVGYINDQLPDSFQVNPTFYKRMRVTTISKFYDMKPITANYIFAYMGGI